MQNLNWNNIRPLNNSQKDGFEELVCQLAKNDNIENVKAFIRKGSPDAGVECFWILDDDKEICYQAKFFTSPLSSTQWGEVDESVKTALEKHPNIIKYVISIPQDRADARIIGRKSFLDKWSDSVKKWQDWAKEKGKEVEFIYEGSSELFDKLSKPENIGKTLFWFNKEEYSDVWFSKQNKSKIEDLGVRYSPEINIDSDIKYVFDGLYLNNKFKNELKNNIHTTDNEFYKFIESIEKHPEIKKFSEETHKNLKSKYEEIKNIDDFGRFKKIKSLFENAYNYFAAHFGNTYSQLLKGDENENDIKQKFDKYITSIYYVFNGLNNFDSKLADEPYLLIEGKAGAGKSHLIADVITEKFKENQYSILLLGQQFYKDNVWTQIRNELEIKETKDEFLGALNSKAESLGTRIIFYIDAINEGEGKEIWSDHLNGLLEDFKHFPNLGLVLTIRSTYIDLILPEGFLSKVPNFEHRGFTDLYNATKVFFEYFNIQEPPIPILNPEFNNPLFLKLFCKGLYDNGLKSIPQDYDNLNIIFDYLFGAVNKSLAKKFDYISKDFNLVDESLELLILEMIKSPSFQIARKDANDFLKRYFKNDVSDSRNILRELINENVLNENVTYNPLTEKYDKEILYFSYERLGDYLIAKTLLQDDIEIIKKEKKITSDCKIHQYVKDENCLIRNKGFIDAFSILLPEKLNFELYELLGNSNLYTVGECFLESLIWRNKTTIGEKIDSYLNDYILSVHGLRNQFLEVLIQLSLREEHYLNAYFLDEFLSGMEMNDRDYYWTIFINDSESAKLFSDWIFNSNSIIHFSNESTKLISIILAWLLTSSNRELRDTATKGLVKLFQGNLSLLERLLKFFENTNDLYVIERLYAVAYGATLRTNEDEQVKIFSTFIFNHIFKNKNPIEHHLVRDYARGIVEFAKSRQLLEFEINEALPPYGSMMPENIPTKEEVEIYKIEEKGFTLQNSLYNLVMGFSDFARYTLGTNHFSKLSNITVESYNAFQEVCNTSKKNKQELENIIIFCQNYTSEFVKQEWKDRFKDFYDDMENGLRVLFKLPVSKSKLLHNYILKISGDYFSESRFDISIIQRLIVNDVFKNYGWKNEFFENHDYRHLRESYFDKNTYSNYESIGKKYVLISYYKWLSVILDNYLINLDYSNGDEGKFRVYTGSWATGRRDIDPTLLEIDFYKSDTYQNDKITFWYPENNIDWNNSNLSQWVLNVKDLIHPSDLISFKDEHSKQWLNLYSYPSWYREKDENGIKKQVWYHIKSFIIKKNDKTSIIKALKNKSFFNHQIPQERDVYEVYSREYYWSRAYDDCAYEKHPETRNRALHTEVNGKNNSGFPTSMNYIWYKERDFTLKENVRIKRPTKYLFNFLNLHLKNNEHEFFNSDNELIVFNPAIKFKEGNDCLLVNKQYLQSKLKENDLEIIWLVLGAKEAIGEMSIINEGNINSIFHFNDRGEIEGDFNLVRYKPT